MSVFKYKHTYLQSFGTNVPPIEVTSLEIEDRLSELYKKLNIPFGTLEKLSGIASRRFFSNDTLPSAIGFKAAEQALENLPFPRENIGIVINCSVARDYFEPATAVINHQKLGLPESAMAFDITNACIGMSNGITLLGNLIESGVVKAGLLISGESVGSMVNGNIDYLAKMEDINRGVLLNLLPTLTLGSGGVAMVMCHESLATTSHKVIGSVSVSASEHSALCVGNKDFCYYMPPSAGDPIMHTESGQLIANAAIVGGRVWKQFSENFGWTRDDVGRIYCHQVGKVVNDNFYKTVGLDLEKEYTIYQKYGNQVSVAMPTAVAEGASSLAAGTKTMLLGYGSGLNCIYTGIEW